MNKNLILRVLAVLLAAEIMSILLAYAFQVIFIGHGPVFLISFKWANAVLAWLLLYGLGVKLIAWALR